MSNTLNCTHCGQKSNFTDEDLKSWLIKEPKGVECTNPDCKSHNKEKKVYMVIFLPQGTSFKEFDKLREGNKVLSTIDLGPEDEDEDEENIDEDELMEGAELEIQEADESSESLQEVEL